MAGVVLHSNRIEERGKGFRWMHDQMLITGLTSRYSIKMRPVSRFLSLDRISSSRSRSINESKFRYLPKLIS